MEAKVTDPEAIARFLFPPNPRRRKRIEEFVDKRHPVMTRWYELLERGLTRKKDINELFAMSKEDPEFFDPVIEISNMALEIHDEKKAFEMALVGYITAVGKIADKNGDWPKIMEWGWLENRHLMRMLHHFAWLLWYFKQPEHCAMILRRILRMNPGDNQGVRHELLAIRLGLSAETWDRPFLVQKGSMAGEALQAVPLDDWFEKNACKFPDELKWLFEEWKKQDG